jgi:hypothetical protein
VDPERALPLTPCLMTGRGGFMRAFCQFRARPAAPSDVSQLFEAHLFQLQSQGANHLASLTGSSPSRRSCQPSDEWRNPASARMPSDIRCRRSYRIERGAAVLGLVRFPARTGPKCLAIITLTKQLKKLSLSRVTGRRLMSKFMCLLESKGANMHFWLLQKVNE